MRGNTRTRGRICVEGCGCGKHSDSFRETMRRVQTGRAHTDAEKEKRRESLRLSWGDPAVREKRTNAMLRAQFKPTGPERRVHAWLDGQGKEYVIHPVVPVVLFGRRRRLRPDILIPAENLILEVNGCYVHGCEACYGDHGFVHNRTKDAVRYEAFRRAGYSVDVIWEHELPHLEAAAA